MSQRIAESLLRSLRDPGTLLIRRVTYPVWAPIATPGRKKYGNLFEKTQTMSADSMQTHQSTHLRALLLHAYRHVPFYRRSMEDAGITPLDIQTPDDLARLPPLTRWSLENRREDLTARGPRRTPEDPAGEFSRYDRRYRAVKAALVDRYRQNAGLYPWMRYASMGERAGPGSSRIGAGAFASLAGTVIDRRIQFDLSADREDAFRSYLPALRKYQPDHLVGTADLISEFALYCRSNGIDAIRFKAALVEEGSISKECCAVVESVFRTRVFLKFGCERIPLIAWQCSEHAGLHVNEDAMIVELDPLPGSPTGHGRVLVTDLFNFTMPLIRFEIGSVASCFEPTRCSCGCTLRRLASIEGSVYEYMSRRAFETPSSSGLAAALAPGRAAWIVDGHPDKRWLN